MCVDGGECVECDECEQACESEDGPCEDHPSSVASDPPLSGKVLVGHLLLSSLGLELLLGLERLGRVRARRRQRLILARPSGRPDLLVEGHACREGDKLDGEGGDRDEGDQADVRPRVEPERLGDVSTGERIMISARCQRANHQHGMLKGDTYGLSSEADRVPTEGPLDEVGGESTEANSAFWAAKRSIAGTRAGEDEGRREEWEGKEGEVWWRRWSGDGQQKALSEAEIEPRVGTASVVPPAYIRRRTRSSFRAETYEPIFGSA